MIRILKGLLLPGLAAVGLLMACIVVMGATGAPPPAQPVAEPGASPFASAVSGSGLTETPGRSVGIAAFTSGVVTVVAVTPGQAVARDAVLFQLDDRTERATRDQRQADLASARAQVMEAEAQLADYRAQLRFAEAVTDRRAISAEDLSKRRQAVRLYEAKLTTAQASVTSAQAQLVQAQASLDRLTVRAPFDAQVLQVNVRVGEYASAAALDTALVVLGRQGKLQVRVEIDENDAWRVRPDRPGRAYLRGNSALSSPLRFVRIEPYVVPKTSLTGSSSERVDTRVLQVVMEIEAEDLPLYAGQILDVFIEAEPLTLRAGQAAPS
ncbi:HlyD family efflux transporter periplasmic adaptor subunit [Roseomonas sp. GC11]|uniref:efflux RND transporter periplasmic adaptor subunit n=1 Tax=Roseomonas sp. GC11 TaxID=2950546 RepID=UPI00210C8438|nr:HlyD family efflux transporter periplasmic adaptor subunit [Roseomonas sp. GC11]MCQ4161000.1 HlyD family efflux transporter periplasmic adaptor subunit [Roseomonas sp. GC11]